MQFEEPVITQFTERTEVDPLLVRWASAITGGKIKETGQAYAMWALISILLLAWAGYHFFNTTKYRYPSAKDHAQEELDYIKQYQSSLPH